MKIKNYFIVTLLCLVMTLTGCFGMQIKGDPELSAVAEIAARRIGYLVAQNENANLETIRKYCDYLLIQDDETVQKMALHGLRYLATKYTGDPLVADDLVTILKLLGIDLSVHDINLDWGD